jgi:hypothetical protein
MPTYVSMINWTGQPQPAAVDVRRALGLRARDLRHSGLHSLVFLPDEGDCAAVMVCTCRDADAVVQLAARIYPDTKVRVESMQFDDDPGVPSWVVRESTPPPAHVVRAPVPPAAVTSV